MIRIKLFRTQEKQWKLVDFDRFLEGNRLIYSQEEAAKLYETEEWWRDWAIDERSIQASELSFVVTGPSHCYVTVVTKEQHCDLHAGWLSRLLSKSR